MSRWSRRTDLSASSDIQQEIWEHTTARGERLRFEVAVKVGKALDVRALKAGGLRAIRDYARFLQESAERLYQGAADRERVDRCPCCNASAEKASETLRILGAGYVRCPDCSHVFVRERPSRQVLDEVFRDSEEHASTYVDQATVEVRLREVVAPKLDWVVEVFRRCRGRAPRGLVDVGAGGGHLLEGARRRGLAVRGFELSAASRRFAREAFGLELLPDDFVAAPPESSDLVTLFGLLEYTPDPRRFLEAARRWLRPKEGLLIVEVPRFDCVGTLAQSLESAVVARHMDPTTHVNCFSDASLATALVETGFAPCAAWYFGMDAYELLAQVALRLDDESILDRTEDLVPVLQGGLDRGRQCDDLVLAAEPVE